MILAASAGLIFASSSCFHSCHIRARLGLAQRKGRDLVAARHRGQIRRLLRRRAAERDRAAAQALHGKRKVGQRRIERQRLAQHHQRA
jgi:hypothetical protein